MNRKLNAIIWGLAGNIFLTISKILLSFLSGSMAMLADAFHSLSDLFVSLLLLIGLKIDNKKTEAVITFIVGWMIIGVAISFAIELWVKEQILIGNVLWTVSGQTLIIIVTYLLYRFKFMVGKREQSESLIADGKHTKSDMLSSIGVLISLAGTLIGLNLDKIAAFIIFFLVLYQGLETLKTSVALFRGKENLPWSFKGKTLVLRIYKKQIEQWKVNQTYRVKIVSLLSLFLALAYVLPGFYIVQQNQKAVVRVLGVIDENVKEPGLHFNPLHPLSHLYKIDTETIRNLEFGFSLLDSKRDDIMIHQMETINNSKSYSFDETEQLQLSGDGSLLMITLNVEYNISNPLDYLLECEDPLAILSMETGSQLQKIVGTMDLFEVLNVNRKQVEQLLFQSLSRAMIKSKTGFEIKEISINSVVPHLSTVYMFRKVQDEEETKKSLIYNALAIKERQLPYYRGLAQEKITKALSLSEQIINRAKSEVEEYKKLELVYLSNREAMSFKLKNENRTLMLKNIKKILIDQSLKENTIRIEEIKEVP